MKVEILEFLNELLDFFHRYPSLSEINYYSYQKNTPSYKLRPSFSYTVTRFINNLIEINDQMKVQKHNSLHWDRFLKEIIKQDEKVKIAFELEALKSKWILPIDLNFAIMNTLSSESYQEITKNYLLAIIQRIESEK